MLTSVEATLNSSLFYDNIVNEGISADELQGTRSQCGYLVRAMFAHPLEKFEPLVAKHDAELTEHFNMFQGEWQGNRLAGFRDAQIMIGFVNTVFNEAGIEP